MQCTSTLLMVHPASFGFNEQTVANNYFQDPLVSHSSLQHQALKEFDMLVEQLRNNQIEVLVIDVQLTELKKYVSPLVADVSSIEKAGGGSVRCMVAEIF